VKTFCHLSALQLHARCHAGQVRAHPPGEGPGPHMIAIVTAQELRANLGDAQVSGRTCTEWIDTSIAAIERDFLKPEHQALMEIVGPGGEILDHFDGRTLNPGHAIECAWFLLHEGRLRADGGSCPSERRSSIGCGPGAGMRKHGGVLYFTDLRGGPVQNTGMT